jgi:FKBP-type peptidyl-prolyl cis-trans isomerase FkpA
MSRFVIVVGLFTSLAALAGPPDAPTAKPPAPMPTGAELNKTFNALGQLIARPVAAAGLTEAEVNEVIKGFKDAALGKTSSVNLDEYGPKVDQVMRARIEENQKKVAEKEKVKAKDFLAKAEKEKGAQKQPSGLIYFETKAGDGKSPAPTDTVKVHYKGTLTSGEEFDSSYKRGTPAEFPLNGVIKCWTEGVAKMKVGGKAKLICPSEIAYGDRGAPPKIPGGAVLQFEVELLEIKAPAPQMQMPPMGK